MGRLKILANIGDVFQPTIDEKINNCKTLYITNLVDFWFLIFEPAPIASYSLMRHEIIEYFAKDQFNGWVAGYGFKENKYGNWR